MVYLIKKRIKSTNNDDADIAVLKPDHVSLGKCVTCHQFIRKYATIQSLDVVSMLRDGCQFNGFKKISIESSEEEGFVNMHHVLVLHSFDGERKREVCVRRKNVLTVSLSELKSKNEVVTDTRTVVLIVYNPQEFLEFFYFGKSCVKVYKVNFLEEKFKVSLASDVLYIYHEEQQKIQVINFKYNTPFEKRFFYTYDLMLVVATSNEMIVWSQNFQQFGQGNNGLGGSQEPRLFLMDNLEKNQSSKQLLLTQELIMELTKCKIIIVSVNGSIFWICPTQTKCSVYIHTTSNELRLCTTFDLSTFYPDCDSFLFTRSCYCSCTSQVFLLYTQDKPDNTSSFVLVLDLHKMQVTSILEMELTLNRKPRLQMYPNVDGSKLFVQETFENRVIFYQVFSLIPSGLSLQNITKQFIWSCFSELEVKNADLPKQIKDELLDGIG